uniref:Transposase n=1 Tax=Heterorhabditis bacteriophora TaxID=37862 RepID=A0A1I7WG69_HETBA
MSELSTQTRNQRNECRSQHSCRKKKEEEKMYRLVKQYSNAYKALYDFIYQCGGHVRREASHQTNERNGRKAVTCLKREVDSLT